MSIIYVNINCVFNVVFFCYLGGGGIKFFFVIEVYLFFELYKDYSLRFEIYNVVLINVRVFLLIVR